jgi:hypothetical protein
MEGVLQMSWFPYASLEEEILNETKRSDLSDADKLIAVLQVAAYYADRIKDKQETSK